MKLTGKRRCNNNNTLLGGILAFIAGAINAGGYFIVQHYTSHMTGIISAAADNIAVKEYFSAFLMLAYVVCFILGATCTTVAILLARKYHLNSQYALPIFLEALVIIAFSLLWVFADIKISYFICILCFLMGLQNALITKASSAIIRTTHISGMATDLGIEIGRYIFLKNKSDITSNIINAKRHAFIICAFFVGGVIGAVGVKLVGVYAFFIFSVILLSISVPTITKDITIFIKILQRIRIKRDRCL